MATDIVMFFALEREARPFRRLCPHIPVHLTGVGFERAQTVVENVLLNSKPRLLILAGFGGALTIEARVGDVFIAKEVCDEAGNHWPCHTVDGVGCRMLTVDRMIVTREEKSKLGGLHSAQVCDMESSAVAAVCKNHGVPFLAVRTISDTADHSLPIELNTIIDNGVFSKRRAFLALLKKPQLIGEFWKLKRNTELAAERLAQFLQVMIVAFNRSQSSPSSSAPQSSS